MSLPWTTVSESNFKFFFFFVRPPHFIANFFRWESIRAFFFLFFLWCSRYYVNWTVNENHMDKKEKCQKAYKSYDKHFKVTLYSSNWTETMDNHCNSMNDLSHSRFKKLMSVEKYGRQLNLSERRTHEMKCKKFIVILMNRRLDAAMDERMLWPISANATVPVEFEWID